MSAPVIDAYLEELLHDPVPQPMHHEPMAAVTMEPAHVGPAAAMIASDEPVAAPRRPEPLAVAPSALEPAAPAPSFAPPDAGNDALPFAMPSRQPSPPEAVAPHRQFVPDESTPRAVVSGSRWLRVGVGHDSYGLELLCVQEVVRMAPILAMRGAGISVLGVMNLRGRIVPVLDLGLWLGLSCVQVDEHSRIVVVERNDELIGVLVTKVEDVATLNPADVEPPLPGTIPGAFLGIARVGQTPTVLLQAEALFA